MTLGTENGFGKSCQVLRAGVFRSYCIRLALLCLSTLCPGAAQTCSCTLSAFAPRYPCQRLTYNHYIISLCGTFSYSSRRIGCGITKVFPIIKRFRVSSQQVEIKNVNLQPRASPFAQKHPIGSKSIERSLGNLMQMIERFRGGV